MPTPDSEPEITQVVLNGAMMEAGVQAGDIIREINGETIETSQEIQEYWEKIHWMAQRLVWELKEMGRYKHFL